jgi:hypothetical protein
VQEQEHRELAGVEVPPLRAPAERVAERGQYVFFAEAVDAPISIVVYNHCQQVLS